MALRALTNPTWSPSAVQSSASKEAAATAAAHDVLVSLFPAYAPNFDALYAATLGTISNSRHKAAESHVQLLRELKSLRMRDFEALRNAKTHGLLRKPIHSDPLADCSGRQVALVREIVKAKRATARQIEMVEHL